MASTYTAAGIELVTQGEQAGAWGDTTNTNWEMMEEMVGGVVSVALSTTSETLTTSDGASSDGRHAAIVFTGSPGGTCTVTVSPNDMQKIYFIVNNSDQTVTLSQGSGANVSIAAGSKKIVYCDGAGAGAAVVDITTNLDISGLHIDGVEVTATAAELNYVDATSSIQTQLDAMVEKAGDTMTGFLTLHADPTSNLHAATKVYVDNLVTAGVSYHDPVRGEVSDAEGNLNALYDNGTSGVGATLTNNGTLAAFAYGGISDWAPGERVLIYNQTTQTQNGIYTVTTVGDGATAWVLTRATDADSYGGNGTGLSYGTTVFVQEGSGSGELYTCNTSGTITFGTTNITFAQIGTAAIYSAGTGLDLSTTTFSHSDTSSQASVNNSGNTFIQDVTLDGFGHVTGLTSATAVINDGTLTMGVSGTGLSGSASFTANQSGGSTFTVTSNATHTNTPSTIVARGASGNFSAGTITANLTGNASGNAGTATALQTARAIGGVSFDGTADINLPGVNTAGNQSTSGNAATATKLATARTISLTGDVTGSASFDGSANASITATVADDSHNHIISNVDGLQTALDAKADDATTVTAGTGLSGGGTLGSNMTLALDLNELTTSTTDGDGDYFAVVDTLGAQKKLTKGNINISGFNNDAGYSTTTGTVTSIGITAGTGIGVSGSPVTSSGSITVTNNGVTSAVAGAGIDVSAGTGAVTISVESDLRGDVFYIGRDTNDYYLVNTTTHDWYLDGVLDMRLENDGDLHCDGDVIAYSTTTSSDEKLKDNIRVVEDSIGKLKQLRGVEFEWKKDGKSSAGVIAQDVEKVLPQAVKTVEDLNTQEPYKTVNYDALHALLIEAVKELSARVESLEAKLG